MCALTAAQVPHSHGGLEAAGLGSSGLDCCPHHCHCNTDSLMGKLLLRNSGFFGAFISPDKL